MPKQLVSSLEKSANWHQGNQNIQPVISPGLWLFSRCPRSLWWKKLLITLCSFRLSPPYLPAHRPSSLCWCFSIGVKIQTFKNIHVRKFLKLARKLPKLSSIGKGEFNQVALKAWAPFRFWTRGLSGWMDRKSKCVRAAQNNNPNKTAILTPCRPPLRKAALRRVLHAK